MDSRQVDAGGNGITRRRLLGSVAAAGVERPGHQPHLENFFDAVRGRVVLTCPAAVAHETALPILRTNEAVAAQRRIEIAPSEYKA